MILLNSLKFEVSITIAQYYIFKSYLITIKTKGKNLSQIDSSGI